MSAAKNPAPKNPAPRDPAAAGKPAINPQFASYKLSIKPSGIHRYGVFAREFIPKGRKVIEYTGEKISRAETARRSNNHLNYLFTLNSYWTVDGSVGGSGAEYVNHSCDPNCHAWIFKEHILYMSGRDIQPGEELTLDYRFEANVERVPCKCGSPSCRGTINLKKERKPRKKADTRARKRTAGP